MYPPHRGQDFPAGLTIPGPRLPDTLSSHLTHIISDHREGSLHLLWLNRMAQPQRKRLRQLRPLLNVRFILIRDMAMVRRGTTGHRPNSGTNQTQTHSNRLTKDFWIEDTTDRGNTNGEKRPLWEWAAAHPDHPLTSQ